MPIYEYKCGKCGHKFEYLAKTASDSPAKCSKCGTERPNKQMSAFSATVAEGGGGNDSCSSGSCSTGSCGTGCCPY